MRSARPAIRLCARASSTTIDRVSPYPLRTERLLLRFVREGDEATITAYRNDPEVSALQDWDLPYPRENADRLIAAHRERTDIEPGGSYQVGIEREGELLGDLYVGLHEQGGVAEIGFTLRTEHQGKGYAREAAEAVIDDLVERLGVHRVFAQLSPDNHASAGLLERLGFTVECLAPKSYWWRGQWDDNLIYALSDEQWRAHRAAQQPT